MCDTADLVEFTRLAKTIRRWETPLLRWHTTGLTNASTEGTYGISANPSTTQAATKFRLDDTALTAQVHLVA